MSVVSNSTPVIPSEVEKRQSGSDSRGVTFAASLRDASTPLCSAQNDE